MLLGALVAALVWWLFCMLAQMRERVLEAGLVVIVVLAVLVGRPRDPA